MGSCSTYSSLQRSGNAAIYAGGLEPKYGSSYIRQVNSQIALLAETAKQLLTVLRHWSPLFEGRSATAC
jgi:hypothetical protein